MSKRDMMNKDKIEGDKKNSIQANDLRAEKFSKCLTGLQQ
jgi:hypothetical protein